MNTSKRQQLVGGGAVLVLALVAGGIWMAQRRRERAARTPAWTDPQQPPEGTAGEPTQLTADQSWAANRCTSLSACCASNTAGMRTRRLYPASLTSSPDSLVRGLIDVEAHL